MAQKYSDKFIVIGLHDWNMKSEDVAKFCKQKEMNWTNGMLTPKIAKGLLSGGGYYYYVLIDPDGKILKFGTSLDEIEEILSAE